MNTFKIILSGRVQGVGFRYFTESRANKYNIKGYVRNTVDNKVEITCQGEDEELKQFIEEIKKGPAFSVVTDISIQPVTNPKNYYSFEIKF
ncbi:MAG: acylphosphatase [Actinomycetia bacterium]|nr:acylphosphatase [Actinomycetes bacterium]